MELKINVNCFILDSVHYELYITINLFQFCFDNSIIVIEMEFQITKSLTAKEDDKQ